MKTTGGKGGKVEVFSESRAELSLRGEEEGAYQLLRDSLTFSSPVLIGIGLVILALGLNLYQIGAPSMWFDELLSVERARQDLPTLWKVVTISQPNMALYYFFLHFWLQITDVLGILPTETVVRFPSAICAAIASMLVFIIGRRLIGLWAGMVAALLYMLNDLQLIYTQETRSYAIQLALICLGWYALLMLMARDPGNKRLWICYSICMILSVYIHLFSMLVFFSQGIAIAALLIVPTAWRATARSQWKQIGLSGGAVLIGIFPMVRASSHGSLTGWIPVPHPSAITSLINTIVNYDQLYRTCLLAFCLLAIIAGLATHSSLMRKRLYALLDQNRMGAKVRDLFPLSLCLLCWLVIPIVVSYLVSQGSIRLFLPRYLVVTVPPLFLLVSLGLSLFAKRRLVSLGLTLILVLLAARQVPMYYQSAQVEDWNYTAHWLERVAHPDDGVICYDNANGCQLGISYYLQIDQSPIQLPKDAPGYVPWIVYDLHQHRSDPKQALNPEQIEAYSAKHPRFFYIVGRPTNGPAVQRTQNWLDKHYHLIALSRQRTVSIFLYEPLQQ